MPAIADTPRPPHHPTQRLHEREEELRSLLRSATDAAIAGEHAEISDFMDLAAEDIRAVVDGVAQAHAAAELSQVVAALRRIEDDSYGLCQDCGEPIDERRLRALPATPFCTACQAIHERPAAPRR